MAIGHIPRCWLVWLDDELDNGWSNAAQHRLTRVWGTSPFRLEGQRSGDGDGRELDYTIHVQVDSND